jgi:hypothetical protein
LSLLTELTKREVVAAILLVVSLGCLLGVHLIDHGLIDMTDTLWQRLLDIPHVHLIGSDKAW